MKHVVRVAPCAAGMTAFDYLRVLEYTRKLGLLWYHPGGICYDAATPVVKGPKILASSEDRHPQISSFEEEQLDSHDALVSIDDTKETTNDRETSAVLRLFL